MPHKMGHKKKSQRGGKKKKGGNRGRSKRG